MREPEAEYAAYPHLPGTHFYANFGHEWLQLELLHLSVVARDRDRLVSRFEEAGLRDTDVANDYRRKVLQAAGSKPAADFVADFLGREFSTEAYIKSLQSDG